MRGDVLFFSSPTPFIVSTSVAPSGTALGQSWSGPGRPNSGMRLPTKPPGEMGWLPLNRCSKEDIHYGLERSKGLFLGKVLHKQPSCLNMGGFDRAGSIESLLSSGRVLKQEKKAFCRELWLVCAGAVIDTGWPVPRLSTTKGILSSLPLLRGTEPPTPLHPSPSQTHSSRWPEKNRLSLQLCLLGLKWGRGGESGCLLAGKEIKSSFYCQ